MPKKIDQTLNLCNQYDGERGGARGGSPGAATQPGVVCMQQGEVEDKEEVKEKPIGTGGGGAGRGKTGVALAQ